VDVIESGAAVLHAYDPRWPGIAGRLIAQRRQAAPDRDWIVDHIGSTAVPGLVAKNIINLQICAAPLPSYAELDRLIGPLGYGRARGARPDSPGVFRDITRGSEPAGDEVWEKRLYLRPGDPLTVLHIRRADSPFARYTIWFRDWLRAHAHEPCGRRPVRGDALRPQARASVVGVSAGGENSRWNPIPFPPTGWTRCSASFRSASWHSS